MEFTSRAFDFIADKEVFEGFLKKRGDSSEANFEYFPPTGVIVFVDEKPICVGFMIICDNKTCMNTDIISDPDFTPDIRHYAVTYLRHQLALAAKEAGINYVIAVTNQPKLIERLKEQGYVELNKNLTHLGRVLWP